MIALILPWDVPEIMDMVNMEAGKHDLKHSCCQLWTDTAAIDTALAYQVEGLIWMPYFEPDKYKSQIVKLRKYKLPLFYMLNELDDPLGDFAASPTVYDISS